MSGNTILITGGATGIGLALAEALVKTGNEVIVCARTEENLKQAKENVPQLHAKKCDKLWIFRASELIGLIIESARFFITGTYLKSKSD